MEVIELHGAEQLKEVDVPRHQLFVKQVSMSDPDSIAELVCPWKE